MARFTAGEMEVMRILWEHGGARNLDLVTPAAAQAYLDKEQS